MIAFYEIEVRILHFFNSVGVGLAAHRPPAGGTPGGGRKPPRCGRDGRNPRRINELRVLYPPSGQLYIMGIIRTDSDNPLRIKHLRVV